MTLLDRKQRAHNTRQQLLRAAESVIGSKGYSAATVDEIVELAGVSKGTAYVHFKNKAALAQSILEGGLGSLTCEFETLAEQAPTAQAALRSMVEVFAERIFDNQEFGRFFVSELWREGRVWSQDMRAYEMRLLTVLSAQIKRGQEEGSIRPDLDPDFDAVAIVGMVLTSALYYIGTLSPERANTPLMGERLSQKEFVEHIADFVHHAHSS